MSFVPHILLSQNTSPIASHHPQERRDNKKKKEQKHQVMEAIVLASDLGLRVFSHLIIRYAIASKSMENFVLVALAKSLFLKIVIV